MSLNFMPHGNHVFFYLPWTGEYKNSELILTEAKAYPYVL